MKETSETIDNHKEIKKQVAANILTKRVHSTSQGSISPLKDEDPEIEVPETTITAENQKVVIVKLHTPLSAESSS